MPVMDEGYGRAMSAELSESPYATVVVRGGQLDDWLSERQRLGQDGRDEVWDGVYHVVPHADSTHGMLSHRLGWALWQRATARKLIVLGEFNLGTHSRDYRVPDMGWISADRFGGGLYVPSVDIVVEFESKDDETWEKVPYYFSRGVREVWVVTPDTLSVTLLVGPDVERDLVKTSDVMGVTVEDVRAALGWS